MNDITKHPLYEPHMGCMDGFRFVQEKEPLQENDEAIGTRRNLQPFEWTLIADHCFGEKPELFLTVVFRRRIAPAVEKPEEQKRFVTVVVEMNEAVDLKSSLAKSELHVSEIREGNYLEKFDNRKERVLKALEGEEV